MEYITAIIIAAVILFAGTSSLYQSITKVIAPDETDFKFYSYIIISVAVVTKLVFGTYVKRVGKKLNSTSLIATGTDAFFDALLSLGTLVGAVLVMITGILLFDGVIGIIISLFILKSGISILTETFSSIIGARVDDGLTDRLKKEINSFDNVLGVYDLTLHNYGPTKFIGTAHVEVPDDLTAKEIHKLSRLISASVYTKFGIILTIGVYASGNTNPLQPAIKSDLEEVLKSFPEVKQMHAFYIDEDLKAVSFDLIVDFSADAENTRSAIIQKISSIHPDYRYFVVLDADYSD
ncbi:MAG: cation diffusion facilitator family transporter [Clostridia bacterium]|nr:cation diffusion facilitator family transporter [Clostridia bacterium]